MVALSLDELGGFYQTTPDFLQNQGYLYHLTAVQAIPYPFRQSSSEFLKNIKFP
jgi:hypothetical protein